MSAQALPLKGRKIIHVDMDCFFAAIEILEHPQWASRPVAVGGQAHRRGVLCTCNYVARLWGLHSAMPTRMAQEKCPQLIIVPPDIPKYKAISNTIFKILAQTSMHIEPLSLDEAFIDVSDQAQPPNSATALAQQLQAEIYHQTRLHASCGVSINKFLAKIASDWNKPKGLKVIPPHQVDTFVKALPVKKIFGVGPVTAKKLAQMGIVTCQDLQSLPLRQLVQRFGKMGGLLYERSRGIDHRPVETVQNRKSLSVEETFPYDFNDIEQLKSEMYTLLQKLEQRLDKVKDKSFDKVFVKIKFSNFVITTIERTLAALHRTEITGLFLQAWQRHKKPVRLIGVGVKFNSPKTLGTQLDLKFDEDKN